MQTSTSVFILDFRFDWLEMILNIQEYYFQVDECSRPRILGMTASPVIRKGEILDSFLLQMAGYVTLYYMKGLQKHFA